VTLQENKTPLTERTVVRRGLMAGLAGLGAAALLKLAGASGAEAANDDPILIGQANSGTTRTVLGSSSSATATFIAYHGPSAGSIGSAGGDGIQGTTDSNAGYTAGLNGFNFGGGVSVGTLGHTKDTNGVGVVGRSGQILDTELIPRGGIGVEGQASHVNGIGTRGINSQNGTGVYGASNAANFNAAGDGTGKGVHGKSGTGFGVLGESTALAGGTGIRGVSGGNGPGVRGVSNSGGNLDANGTGTGPGVYGSSGGGEGVKGESQTLYGVSGVCFGSSVGTLGLSVNGAGVWGQSTNYVGVYGNSQGNATAVYGVSSGTGFGIAGDSSLGIGMYGVSHAPFVPAMYAQSQAATGKIAGRFDGDVQVFGSYSATGLKMAVVPHPDGSMRSLYCVESSEAWFEDFGRARLVNGQARVTIDGEFGPLVHLQDYHVFPVAEGPCNGLYIAQQDPKGFEVREINGRSNVAFSYRLVARRKDVQAARLQRVDVRALAKPATANLQRSTMPAPNVVPPGFGR
jgi:hypothetical protein